MISFSVNVSGKIDISGINFEANDDLSREYLSSFYLAAATGNWGTDLTDSESRSPKTYALKAYKNNIIKTAVKAKREIPVITSDELDEGSVHGFCPDAPSMDMPNLYTEDIANTASFDERDYYEKQMAQFIDMREYIYLEAQMDIANLLIQANLRSERAIKAIQELRQKFYGLDDLIKDVLKCSNWLRRLEALQRTPILVEEGC